MVETENSPTTEDRQVDPQTDNNHPLHLQTSDTPGVALIPMKFTGPENYGIWSRSMCLNICRGKINHFEIHEGGSVKVGSIVSWKYNDDGKDKIAKQVIDAVDLQKKSITWKVIGGDLLKLYNSFTIITSCDKQWTTWTFVYEKKTEEIPEPLVLLGLTLDLTKDFEGHLLKK